MRTKRPQRITIEEGIERAHGSYIATVTHEGVRHRQHGLKTLDAARAWRTAKKAELLGGRDCIPAVTSCPACRGTRSDHVERQGARLVNAPCDVCTSQPERKLAA